MSLFSLHFQQNIEDGIVFKDLYQQESHSIYSVTDFGLLLVSHSIVILIFHREKWELLRYFIQHREHMSLSFQDFPEKP